MEKYKLERSKRKTISLSLLPDSSLLVRSPRHVPKSYLDEFVKEKASWIATHRSAMQERLSSRENFRANRPSRLRYLGKEYPLLSSDSFSFNESSFFAPPGNFFELRPSLKELYRTLALPILQERTEIWAKKMGLSPPPIKITLAATRWGSCSAKNRICYSYKLIMADPLALDSVVVHELCHLLHKNHGPSFWKEVYVYLPDYQEHADRLRLLGKALSTEGFDD